MDYATEGKELNNARASVSFRGLLRHGVLSTLAFATKPQPEHSLRLVYAHYVFKDQVTDFEKKIKYLTSIGTFLTADEVLAVILGEKPLDKRFFHLSFDDGFRNIITNALPVLREYSTPATFFVPTSFISADYKIAQHYCLNVTHYPCVIEMASWDDLARAQEHGLEIASHTATHARFSEMSGSTAKLEDEIFGSKADLERNLGRPCRYISWPYGRINDADAGSLDFVKRAGYAACFGAFRGHVDPGKTDPFYIPRHHFEADWPLSHLKYFAHGAGERQKT
jgi:peptidoglycan/xylan/chitin deacetylase (PgdA/CDA1 family)